MVEAIQEQKYFCEEKKIGCTLSCASPDYVRREMFLFNPNKPTFLAEVAESIISNLASRSLELVDRDPLVIAEAKSPNFPCIKATVSAFSREELGDFFAKECVGTLVRVAKEKGKKPATKEDSFIYDCLVRMGAQRKIKEGGNIDGKELLATIKWYFSGDEPEKAQKGAEKYIDLEKVAAEKTQENPIRVYSFSPRSFHNVENPFLKPEQPPLSPAMKEFLTLLARGEARNTAVMSLGNTMYERTYGVKEILAKYNARSVGQVIFRLVTEGEIDISKTANRDTISVISRLDPKDLKILDLITSPPYPLKTDVIIAQTLGISPSTITHHLSDIYAQIGIQSKIVAGVAYLAYKQSCAEKQVPVLSR